MPVPSTFATLKHVVFCYTTDLHKASKFLAALLKCPCIRVVLKGDRIVSVDGDIPTIADVAWLVGHGLGTDTQIGTLARASHVEIEQLLDWLVGEGYSSVVDTCCQPELRRVVAAAYPFDYYCATDGQNVTQIQTSASIDAWWSTNGMHLVASTQVEVD